ncbi:MAG: hypothetical protein AAF999_07815 [Pseudomonadota bacterium]
MTVRPCCVTGLFSDVAIRRPDAGTKKRRGIAPAVRPRRDNIRAAGHDEHTKAVLMATTSYKTDAVDTDMPVIAMAAQQMTAPC